MSTSTSEPASASDAVRPEPITVHAPGTASRGRLIAQLLRTTDPKVIGRMYLSSSLTFFVFGGALALLMRLELERPGRQLLSQEQYNQLFTMHGTIDG